MIISSDTASRVNQIEKLAYLIWVDTTMFTADNVRKNNR